MSKKAKTAIRRDPILLKIAQSIFGKELVIDAFITASSYYDDIKTTKENLDSKVYQQYRKKHLRYDSETIWLKFSNGKTIEFQNSEWAYIKPAGKGVLA